MAQVWMVRDRSTGKVTTVAHPGPSKEMQAKRAGLKAFIYGTSALGLSERHQNAA